MMKTNTTLIRLKDCKTEIVICAFHTERPEHFIALYNYCYEHDIPIHIPDTEKLLEKFKDAEAGNIEDIEVSFGSNICYPCIDVWIRLWGDSND